MQHLLSSWPQFSGRLKSQKLLLCLDYDGTLTPIVATPGDAVFSEAGRQVLTSLVSLPGILVSVVSGRGVADVKNRVGVGGILYSGNHGLEADGPRASWVHPESWLLRKRMAPLAASLRRGMSAFRGVIVEDKGLTVSVHYRNAEPRELPRAQKVFYKLVDRAVKMGHCVIRQGRKVWEIHPPFDWGKDAFVSKLYHEEAARQGFNLIPIYFGDDRTDEGAFRVVAGRGIAVKVGSSNGNSQALYFLKEPREVLECLRKIRGLRVA
ncbi:MAG: trehalose-phosphatase [Candidatus Omnitrophica bacterium]|nr:trehalose-phosphatase [Candidatus Omnitrophota bacterium]